MQRANRTVSNVGFNVSECRTREKEREGPIKAPGDGAGRRENIPPLFGGVEESGFRGSRRFERLSRSSPLFAKGGDKEPPFDEIRFTMIYLDDIRFIVLSSSGGHYCHRIRWNGTQKSVEFDGIRWCCSASFEKNSTAYHAMCNAGKCRTLSKSMKNGLTRSLCNTLDRCTTRRTVSISLEYARIRR